MNRLFLIFITSVFLNALCWAIFIPVWQYPDEQAHFAQVQDFAELNHVPTIGQNSSYEIILSEKYLLTQRDERGDNPFVYHPQKKLNINEGFYGPGEKIINDLPQSARRVMVKAEATNNPPLYYFLSAGIYKIFYHSSLFTRVFAIRIFSLLIFMFTIFLTFKIAIKIFANKPISQITLATSIAFSPMYIFSSTGILTDPLTNLLFTIIIFFCIKILTEGYSKSSLALLIMTIFLGVYTRQHFIISIPIVILAVILRTTRYPKQIKKIIFIVFFVLTMLFLSNFATTIPILSNFRIPEGIFNLKLLFGMNFLQYAIRTVHHTYSETLPWFWGVYKWLSLTLPPVSYKIINRIILLAILGFIFGIYKILKAGKLNSRAYTAIFMAATSILYYLSFLVWDYFFQQNHNFSFGIQGRYFLPMIIPIFYVLLSGLLEVFKIVFRKYTKYALFLLALSTILYSNFSLYFVVSSYYEAQNLSSAINALSQYKPIFLKGNILIAIPLMAVFAEGLFIFSFLRYILRTNESN